MIHLETITPKMHEIARVIYGTLDPAYYLAGGTALALLAGHRESIDLDYFIISHIDTEKLKLKLEALFPSIVFAYEEIDTLWCEIDGVKVSFISRFATCLENMRDEDGFRIAGLKDIVVMKLNAVCGRDEYKDYYDLSELAIITDVRQWILWWNSVYPKSDPISWITALSQGSHTKEVTLRGNIIRQKKEVMESLEKAVREISSFK